MLTAADYASFVGEVFGDGRKPFPWQADLVQQIVDGDGWPDVVDVPTGLGKTSAIDMAVFALAAALDMGRDNLPTRTFFVIDRRIVVDSAFAHAEHLAHSLREPQGPVTKAVAEALRQRAGAAAASPLEVVRMRGGVTWGWRWLRQPDQPAVVVGTVDQFGSRLLFRGYGVGPRLRPIDAALCGTDALVLVDEAHLCGPLLDTVRSVQAYEDLAIASPLPARPLSLVTLSATIRDAAPALDGARREPRVFALTQDRWSRHIEHPVTGPRLTASKHVTLVECDEKRVRRRAQLADELSAIAQTLVADRDVRRLGVVVNTVAVARRVFQQLVDKDVADVRLLVGRVRPFDRQRIESDVVDRVGVGAERQPTERPVVVVATQTIEVGADLSFDALVTEAAPLDALVQRFGRVARLGEPAESDSVVVFAPMLHAVSDPVYGPVIGKAWEVLARQAVRDGGAPVMLTGRRPFASEQLVRHLDLGTASRRDWLADMPADAVTEQPDGPLVLGPTLDAWARTEPVPLPDQPVAPYLHGLQRAEQAVSVCWRADLTASDPGRWARLVETLPPRAHELVEVPLRQLVALLNDAGLDEAAADISGMTVEEPTGSSTGVHPYVLYRGRSDAHVRRSTDSLLAGDVVVLPSTLGGHDAFGWQGQRDGVPVLDVADLGESRGEAATRVLRLDRLVLAQFVDVVPETFDTLLGLYNERDGGREDLLSAVNDLLVDLAAGSSNTEVDSAPGLAEGLSAFMDAVEEARRRLAPGSNGGPTSWDLVDRDRLPDEAAGALTRSLLLRVRAPDGRRDVTDADDCDEVSTSAAGQQVSLADHSRDVGRRARDIAARLGLPAPLQRAVELAGYAHDVGKADLRFQAMLFGNRWEAEAASEPIAKSGRDQRTGGSRFGWPRRMRHEALSAAATVRWVDSPDFVQSGAAVDPDLVVHLVATHHGWSRPLPRPTADPGFMSFDVQIPEVGSSRVTVSGTDVHLDWEAAERFAVLTARYGRWGLALVESVVRLADIACSEEGHQPVTESASPPHALASPAMTEGASSRSRVSSAAETEIPLPALRNDEPLGFLAALGLVSLLELGCGLSSRLGWAGPGQEAILVMGPGWSLDRVVDALHVFVNKLKAEEHLVHPSIPVDRRQPDTGAYPLQGFPLIKEGAAGSDPMRMAFATAVHLAAHVAHEERMGEPVWGRWLAGSVNLCAPSKPGEPEQALSPLYAPTGNQTFDRNLTKPLEAVKRTPSHLRSVLVGWQRVDGFAGANLDYRAERNSATTQDDKVRNLGVPGATWLALMAIPRMRLVGDGVRGQATLFQRPGGVGREAMVWPLWRRPAGPRTLDALIEHPALRLRRFDGRLELDDPRQAPQLRALGVAAVAWAQRSGLNNSDGPIGPATLIPVD